MFFPLSFTEFKKMMQEGVDKLFNSSEESRMQEIVITKNSNNQIETTDDQTQEHSKGN